MLIRNGAWPLRDFYSTYGPGQYFVSAAVYALFGEDLLVSRLADAATLGVTGALVFACVRRMAGAVAAALATLAFGAILAFARPLANYAALTALPLLLLAALLFGDWLNTRRLRALAAASLSVGVASTFRWDFGAYGALSLVLATWLAMRSRPDTGPATRALFTAAAPAIVFGVAVMRSSWVVMPRNGSTKHPCSWRASSPTGAISNSFRPAVHTLERGLRHGDRDAAGRGVMHLAFAITPFVVLPVSAWRSMRIALRPNTPLGGNVGTALLLSLCGLFLLLQMRVRPGLPQGLPAFTCALMLLPTIRPGAGWARNAFHAISFAGLALLCIAGIEAQRKSWATSSVEPTLDRATGVHVPIGPDSVEYAALIAHLRASTAPSEPIFSGVVDTSRCWSTIRWSTFWQRAAPPRASCRWNPA